MLPARALATAAALVPAVLLVLVLPSIAPAHPGHAHAVAAPFGPPAPLDLWDGAAAARDAHEQAVYQREVELTPPAASDGTCDATRRIDGIGAACRTDDGLLRIELPGGGELYTHGPDFLDSATDLDPATTAPHIVAAVRSATKDDVACVPSSTAHTQLVYAVPSDGIDRSTGPQVQALRQSTYEASAVLDNTSRLRDPTAGRRLRIACDPGGEADVRVLRLRRSTDVATFATVRQDVQALLGDDESTPVRYLVYYDADLDAFAGIGSIYTDQADASAANLNNTNLSMALQDDSWGTGPRWNLLLHELSHNMGAVIDGAPDSNDLGHCDDGLDVMCYEEGTGTYVDDACPQLEYDCGGDSYFNPAPAGSSWLATHWNAASTANRFLQARAVTPDTTAPATPTGLAGTGHGDFYRLSWDAVADADVHAYRVEFSTDGTAWGVAGDSWPGETTLDATWDTIANASSWQLRVRAYDERGNLGDPSSSTTLARGSYDAQVATPGGPAFDDPTGLVVTATTGTSATLHWTSAEQNADWYEVDRWTGSAWTNVEWTYVDETSATVTGLPAGGPWQLRVRTADSSGRTSPGTEITVTPGAPAPADPTGATVASSDAAVPTVTWSPAAGAVGYEVATSPATTTTHTTGTSAQVPGLAFGTSYAISVRALGASGAASAAATTTFSTPAAPDTTPPSSFAVTGVGTTTRTTVPNVTWTAASDASGIARYVVLAAASDRPWDFRQVATTTGATSATATGLRPGTQYILAVDAVDAAGNSTNEWYGYYVTTKPDTSAPSTPASATAVATGDSSIHLAWSASTDDTGIDLYRIRRTSPAPTGEVATVPGSVLEWDATGLDPSTTYSFTVEAVDLGGNASGTRSASATTASADSVPPSAPGTVDADTVAAHSVSLSWIAAADDVGVARYEVHLGSAAGELLASPTTTSATIDDLDDATTYTFAVVAVDAAGNRSTSASTITVTTLDATAPASPAGLVASTIAATSLDLAWDVPTDNVGVTGYEVLLDAAPVGTPAAAAMHVGSLAEATQYLVRVRARDAAGNWSALSAPLTVTTLDVTAPSAPTNLHADATDVRAALTWDASTDNRAVTGYRVYDATGARVELTTAPLVVREFVAEGLAPSTTYAFEVTAVDAAGNESAAAQATFTTEAEPDTTAPGLPGALAASLVTTTSLRLAWTAAPLDPSGIHHYEVARHDGTSWTGTQATTTLHVDLGSLAPGTTYRFGVRAVDGAGNASGWVEVQVATSTDADTTPPSLPGAVSATAADDGSVQLSWGAATDDRGVVAYVVSRTIGGASEQVGTTSLTSLRLDGQPIGATALYAVAARDAAGNVGGARTVTVTIPAPPAPPPPPPRKDEGGGGGGTTPTRDRTKPTLPGRVRVRAVRGGRLVVSWVRSRDASGIARYDVRVTARRQRTRSARVPGARTTTTIRGLRRGVRWTVQVRAVDRTGNASRWTSVRAMSRRR